MKIILVVALVLLCGFIGIGISVGYKQKKLFFDAYLSFLQNIKIEIGFTASKLSEIIQKELVNTNNKDFKILLNNYREILNVKIELTKENLFKDIKFLSLQEKDDLFMFFNALGKTDVFNQVDIIKSKIEQVKLTCEKLKKDCDKYCPLFTKLGFLSGLFLALIII